MGSQGSSLYIGTFYCPETDEPFKAEVEFKWERKAWSSDFTAEIVKVTAADGCDDVPMWLTNDMCLDAVYDGILDNI